MSKNGKILTVGSWGCYRAENNPKKSLLVLWLSTRGHNFNFLLWYQQRVVVYTFIPFTPPLYCTPVRLYGYPKIHIIEMGHLQKGPWFSDRGTWGPNIMDTYLGWVDTPDEVYKCYLPQQSLSSITPLAEQSSVNALACGPPPHVCAIVHPMSRYGFGHCSLPLGYLRANSLVSFGQQ